MKQIFTILLVSLLSIGVNVNAQTHHKQRTADAKTRAESFLKNLLQKQSATTNNDARTTVLRERLIGQADYAAAASIWDSSAISYSGARGSRFDLQYLSYRIGTNPDFYPIGSGSPYGYANSTGLGFEGNNGICVLSDSTKEWSVDPFTFTYGPWSVVTHSFDAGNNLLDDAFMGNTALGVIWQRDISTYNSLSNVSTVMEFSENAVTGGLPWDTSYLAVFTYNSANQMAVDSECTYDGVAHQWVPESKYTYTYDGAGNMILAQAYYLSPGWVLSESYTMTYYTGTHELKTFESDTYDPTPIVEYRDSFGYTSGLSYFTYSNQQQYTSGVLSDSTILTKHVNTLGLPDTINSYDYSGATLITHSIGLLVYNSYNDPVVYYSWTDTTSPVAGIFYYYELYDASAVPEVTNAENITVFPNPATNTINIARPGYTPNNITTITIVNAAGQKISAETLPWQKETVQISVHDLSPGTYWIIVADSKNNILHKEQVVKL